VARPRKKRQKVLVKHPQKAPKPQVPDMVKAEVESKARALIESYLKPTYIRPPPIGSDANFLEDIYCRWHHSYFYFCSKYCCPGPRSIAPFFEMGFVRMEYLASGRFNLAYMRPTG